jgi:hypothetical protein
MAAFCIEGSEIQSQISTAYDRADQTSNSEVTLRMTSFVNSSVLAMPPKFCGPDSIEHSLKSGFIYAPAHEVGFRFNHMGE